ncbi:SDR family oxidoreductase [Terriglobus aquaticus]|uniref:SDR family oxidoreductase n=1 Tax=Terriglobus aquaticus TaxID=940139 RepID=A0ABW9KGK9_9BACT|nr:SDR family NAD(P)-dependent oxidoreductase [Terriglobus aquaticus]
MEVTGNTILVTGGTSGIGRALAVALHQAGNTVIVAGRRQNLLDEIEAKYPGIVGMQLDVEDSSALQGFANEVQERFPNLNVLFNNAGIAGMEDYTADTVDVTRAKQTIATNITSVVELSAALLPHLRKQPKSTLMVTTSGLAFVPFPKGPVYSATKAFLHNWLDALRMQLRGTSVEVLELAPPYVQTELGGPQQAQDPRAMPLDAYTNEVMSILADPGKIEKGEVLVENVKHLRWAERDGHYEKTLEMFANF